MTDADGPDIGVEVLMDVLYVRGDLNGTPQGVDTEAAGPGVNCDNKRLVSSLSMSSSSSSTPSSELGMLMAPGMAADDAGACTN